jgi:hypothetical protein
MTKKRLADARLYATLLRGIDRMQIDCSLCPSEKKIARACVELITREMRSLDGRENARYLGHEDNYLWPDLAELMGALCVEAIGIPHGDPSREMMERKCMVNARRMLNEDKYAPIFGFVVKPSKVICDID